MGEGGGGKKSLFCGERLAEEATSEETSFYNSPHAWIQIYVTTNSLNVRYVPVERLPVTSVSDGYATICDQKDPLPPKHFLAS